MVSVRLHYNIIRSAARSSFSSFASSLLCASVYSALPREICVQDFPPALTLLFARPRESLISWNNAKFPSFQICKYDIQESIKREMSGDLRDGMITIGEALPRIAISDTSRNMLMVDQYNIPGTPLPSFPRMSSSGGGLGCRSVRRTTVFHPN